MSLKTVVLLLPSIFVFATSIRIDFSYANSPSPGNVEKKELVQHFEQWMQAHKRTYAQPEDKAHGFENFIKNFEYVHKWNTNKDKGGHVVGLNNFADLSHEEFRQKYLMSKINTRKARERRDELNIKRGDDGCNAPHLLDWTTQGVITPVKSQGDCGSCWSFSSTGAIEAINAIKSGQLISLSEQELVDCVTMNGCDGGYMNDAFDWIISNGGIHTESDYPYIATNNTCNIQQLNGQAESKLVTIDGYEDVAPTDEALLCALLKQPISVGISANVSDFMFYEGGIYDGDCSNNPEDIDHAVLLVGYGSSEDGIDYWILKNSWSTDWGDQGYMYMKRDKTLPFGKCAIHAIASYPTKKHGRFIFINHASSSHVSRFWGIYILVCILFLNSCLSSLLEF